MLIFKGLKKSRNNNNEIIYCLDSNLLYLNSLTKYTFHSFRFGLIDFLEETHYEKIL